MTAPAFAPALEPIAIPQEKIAETIRTGSPEIGPVSPLDGVNVKASLTAPGRSPFNRIAMPDDHVTVAGERFYTLRKISDHIGMSTHNLNRLCNDGKMQFIIKPLTRNGIAGTGTKLIPENEVRRILEGR